MQRFVWQSGGLLVGKSGAFVTLILIARQLGLDRYGRFVVLLALVELAAAPWKPTVQQAAATRLGRGASHRSWLTTMAVWWLVGVILLGPIAWMFEGWTAGVAVIMASTANGAMTEHLPTRILLGHQKRIAFALFANHLTRLVVVVALILVDTLTPAWAIVAYAAGYLVALGLLKISTTRGDQKMTLLLPEVGVEGLRWMETQGPVIVVALILGLDIAGGFDLVFKLATALAEIIAGIGIIMLPALIKSEKPVPQLIARAVRLPTMLSVLAAAGFAIVAGPALKNLTNATIGLGLVPALLALRLALAPWMGATKAALITVGASSWIFAGQLTTASATLVALAFANRGLIWMAAAVAIANGLTAVIHWSALQAKSALPSLADMISLTELRRDLNFLLRLRQRGRG